MTGTYFSIGGGFILADGEDAAPKGVPTGVAMPYPFSSAAELLRMAEEQGAPIWKVMLANESTLREPEDVRAGILHIWSVMQACIERGMVTEGSFRAGWRCGGAPCGWRRDCVGRVLWIRWRR